MKALLALTALLLIADISHADPELDLEAHKGKVVVLDFWASWCVPCRRSFPWMNEMQDKYAKDGLVIIAVNVDRKAANAEAFLAKYPASFQIVFDPEAELAKQYQIEVMPSSFVIGRDGDVVERHIGFKVKRQAEYEEILRTALKLEKQP